jgi:MoaA/NifB/PqqE/SkfB family radical SAM enzyme
VGRGFLARLFARKPAFFAWQVELTTRCPLQCRMCIRTSCDDWRSRDMAIADFRCLAPYLSRVDYVVLQGWGEPLLHPHLIDAITLVRNAGSRPGFVTSGWGLDTARVAELVRSGVAFIGFSLAGVTATTHDAIRVNSHLDDVLEAIATFRKVKADLGVDAPRLHIVYLMLADNAAEMERLPALVKEFGIEQIILINEVQVADAWQNEQQTFLGASADLPSIVAEMRRKASELGIDVQAPSLVPEPVPVCGEDPLRNLFISVDGEVAPCVHLWSPTASPMRRIYCGAEVPGEKLSFGNVFATPLEDIWTSAAYAEFRRMLAARRRAGEDFGRLSDPWGPGDGATSGSSLSLPIPSPCRTCHRMLGI